MRDTQGWEDSPEVMSGGQDSMQTWRKGSESVLSAREVKRCHRSHQSTPQKPWSRLHIDHAGPVGGKILLIIVDTHSKWIDAHIVPSTSSSATIDKLRSIFATHGLPETIVSDNGTAFTSSEFQEFLRSNGIEHLRSAPYHPSSNGLAERAVQTVKAGVKRLKGSLEVRLSRFLFKYRVTPQATTGIAPAELLMGRRLHTHLDLLFPTVRERVQRKQREQKGSCGRHPRTKSYQPGDRVMSRNFADGHSWVPGTVLEGDGTTAVRVRLDDGRIWRRHLDHVTPSQVVGEPEEQASQESPRVPPESDPLTTPDGGSSIGPTPERGETPEQMQDQEEMPLPTAEPEGLRRSSRIRHPPDRFQ